MSRSYFFVETARRLCYNYLIHNRAIGRAAAFSRPRVRDHAPLPGAGPLQLPAGTHNLRRDVTGVLPIELQGGALWYFGFLAFWLGAAELVPILSWLALRGRCKSCGGRISPRYPLTELVAGALGVLCLLRFGLSVLFLRNMAFLCCLFCLSLVDWEISEIPDGCLIVAAAAWALAAPFLYRSWGEAGLALAAGLAFGLALLLCSLAMDRLLKKESLGGGDIKLFAVVGLYLGFTETLLALILACVLGLALAAALRRRAGEPFPFGPAISASAAVMLLWGQGLADWYWSLAGL